MTVYCRTLEPSTQAAAGRRCGRHGASFTDRDSQARRLVMLAASLRLTVGPPGGGPGPGATRAVTVPLAVPLAHTAGSDFNLTSQSLLGLAVAAQSESGGTPCTPAPGGGHWQSGPAAGNARRGRGRGGRASPTRPEQRPWSSGQSSSWNAVHTP